MQKEKGSAVCISKLSLRLPTVWHASAMQFDFGGGGGAAAVTCTTLPIEA